jgi:hypothetical protein
LSSTISSARRAQADPYFLYIKLCTRHRLFANCRPQARYQEAGYQKLIIIWHDRGEKGWARKERDGGCGDDLADGNDEVDGNGLLEGSVEAHEVRNLTLAR